MKLLNLLGGLVTPEGRRGCTALGKEKCGRPASSLNLSVDLRKGSWESDFGKRENRLCLSYNFFLNISRYFIPGSD